MQRSDAEDSNVVERLRRRSERPELAGRRLRLAVLLRAFDDLRQGGRHGWEARRWLLRDDTGEGGLDARALLEEAGLDVDRVRRLLRERDPAARWTSEAAGPEGRIKDDGSLAADTPG